MVGRFPQGNIWGNSVSANVNSVGPTRATRERFRSRRLNEMNRTRNAVMGVFPRSVLSQLVLNYLQNLPEGCCPVTSHTGPGYRIG
jgi:hypothetical protein